MLKSKIISSLEKVMLHQRFEDFSSVKSLHALRGERVSFQLLLNDPIVAGERRAELIRIKIRSRLSKHLHAAVVEYVPVEMPVYAERTVGDFISREAGIYPDILRPIKKNDTFFTHRYAPKAFWFTLDVPRDIPAGEYRICLSSCSVLNEIRAVSSVVIQVHEAEIPKNDLKFTQWMHLDCIADYHQTKIFSKAHWKLIEAYLKLAARTGVNMMLTPLFTPPLDTAIGSYRKTVQLVGVKKSDEQYLFDYSKFDRFVLLCQRAGIHIFEFSHLFTQWGACACPKIEAEVEGRVSRIFGWDTPSDSEEYYAFLSQFLPDFIEHIRKIGIADSCYFHISDEPRNFPGRPDYENYLKAKTFLKRYLSDYKILDALSHVEFFDNGLVEYPVSATNHVEDFLKRKISERWCYYCCTQSQLVSNRFIAMPSYRNRVSGLQFYYHEMAGFLHWGFNFYYTRRSTQCIDPYSTTDAYHNYPAGDCFSVYPVQGGAIESIRTIIFYEGLQDRMILKALEEKLGRDETLRFVQGITGKDVRFDDCLSPEIITRLHDEAILLLDS